MYRQGDLLLIKIKETPKNAELVNSDVVVFGETTGHAHRIQDGEILSLGEQLFIEASSNAKLVHEEHEVINIPQGSYKVIRQREYDEKEIRYVSD